MFWEARLCPNGLSQGARLEEQPSGLGWKQPCLLVAGHTTWRGGRGGGWGAKDRETRQLHDWGGEPS